jgi:hypothetical protein
MARGIQSGGCVLVLVVVPGGASSNKKPPSMTWGKRKSRFLGGMPGQARWLVVQDIPTGDAWSCGLRRRIGLSPAAVAMEGTMTPRDVAACIAVLSWSGRFLRGDQESLRRPQHLFIQPVVPGVAFGSDLKPFALQTSGRAIRHTLRQPGGLPFSSPPRRVTVSRCPARLVRPLTEP